MATNLIERGQGPSVGPLGYGLARDRITRGQVRTRWSAAWRPRPDCARRSAGLGTFRICPEVGVARGAVHWRSARRGGDGHPDASRLGAKQPQRLLVTQASAGEQWVRAVCGRCPVICDDASRRRRGPDRRVRATRSAVGGHRGSCAHRGVSGAVPVGDAQGRDPSILCSRPSALIWLSAECPRPSAALGRRPTRDPPACHRRGGQVEAPPGGANGGRTGGSSHTYMTAAGDPHDARGSLPLAAATGQYRW